jgi:hypothetical protein
VLLALTVGGLSYAGHYFVLRDYPLTRDEQMALFDAEVFARGALVWPIPPEWRGEAAALNLTFMLPVEHPIAWISAYLPGNAALHALVGKLGDPALTGPLLSVVAIAALWSCAKRIWPEDREAATVAIVVLVGGGQFLFSGMSPYAMQAHLALNLVWLRLFIADRRSTDLVALATGWLATGLHQPIFHPLFAGPFLLNLLRERRFDRFALLTLGYGAIGLFWLFWPRLTLALVSGPGSITPDEGIDYISRLVLALSIDDTNFSVMAANLLRLAAWQHVLLIPLLVFAVRELRGNALAQAIIAGPLLTISIMTVILPWQGYGYGYRYIHGQLANLALLAGFGWRWLTAKVPAARSIMAKTTIGGVLLLVPLQAAMLHKFYGGYAAVDDVIDASGADYAMIDGSAGYQAQELVYNRPDLSNRPLRLLASKVRDPSALAARLCKPETSVMLGSSAFYNRIGAAYILPPVDRADARLPALAAPFRQAGCRIVIVH